MNKMDWKKSVAVYFLALGMGLLVAVGLALGCAFLIAGEMLPEQSMGYCAMASVFCGAVATAVIAVGRIKTMRLPVCVVAGAVFLIGLVLVGLVLFGRLNGGILPTAALCLGSSVVVGLFGRKGSGKPKYRLEKMRI